MCQPCWCASAAKTSSSGLGAFVVISRKDSFSSILGSDMYWECRSVHALMCTAAFCSGVWWNTRRQSLKSAAKGDLIPMVHIMRQCHTLGSGVEANAWLVALPKTDHRFNLSKISGCQFELAPLIPNKIQYVPVIY